MAVSSSISAAPLVIAHRGGAHAAPENTIAAFQQGWKDGADGAEGDFFLTRDGAVVCIHDRNTKKLADKELDVMASSLKELKRLDVGRKKGSKWAGERIPTLQEVIATVPEGKKLLIEIKDTERIVAPIKKVLDKGVLKPEQVVFIAFSGNVVAECKKQMPEIKAYWLFSEKTLAKDGVEHLLGIAKKVNADGVDVQAGKKVDQAFVDAARKAGLELHCWTVNDAKTAKRFRDLGFDSITTDRPALVREALAR